jgi:hypothetical protein
MTTWVLFIVFMAQVPAVTTASFVNQEACLHAADVVSHNINPRMLPGSANAVSFCVPGGTPQGD